MMWRCITEDSLFIIISFQWNNRKAANGGYVMNKQNPITVIKGIGNKSASCFAKAGVNTLQDLLHYYPKDYMTYEPPVSIGSLFHNRHAAIKGRVTGISPVTGNRKIKIFSVIISDETGKCKVTFYHVPYFRDRFSIGQSYVFRGRVVIKNSVVFMEQPTIFAVEEYELLIGKIRPIYPLVNGLTNNMVSKAVREALQSGITEEYLPEKLLKKYNLSNISHTLNNIHFPNSMEDYEKARERLVFDEFFFFLLHVKEIKDHDRKSANLFSLPEQRIMNTILQSLPYELTHAQNKVLQDINRDLHHKSVMNRLIQGDVGSGKTILAILAMARIAENGYQSALMVPTDVLARQHYESVSEIFKENAITIPVLLLTGAMTAKEKKLAHEEIRKGNAKIIIGTHALFQEKVIYENLALVITDEQHRFGVKQREALANKGIAPHILVMSATPIPRTLAMILYADLDISVIDEIPKNRIPIKNYVVNQNYRKKAYEFIEKEIGKGRQAYIICPMVEQSEESDLEDVISYTETLKRIMPHVKIEYLHGRLKSNEKNTIMEAFAKNKIQLLVSTTVIEVGVNVPNATVMLVENAERFGLAQLHQLRGRVGRGIHPSYCIFIHSHNAGEAAGKLMILNQTNDGFRIAGEDLKLRGPGELFGIRQSGCLSFQIADIYQDAPVLQMAHEAVKSMKIKDDLWKEHNFTFYDNL